MAQKHKYYVVRNGRRTGIFETWEEASAQVNGFAGAQYKAFHSRAEAELALREGWAKPQVAKTRGVGTEPGSVTERGSVATPNPQRWQQLRMLGVEPPLTPSYASDAACTGNPGVMEYRAVQTESGKSLFARGPFPEGTNNIGEFLGIVETLMALSEQGDAAPVYSDSRIAIAWVAAKQCRTQLQRSKRNGKLFDRIGRAEQWLRANQYRNKILKWRTEVWGENPADYGRK